jgi:UDP-N-acetylmuramoyl-tripeptide--D-alanyl-D-alanine ligase
MRDWDAARVAGRAGAELRVEPHAGRGKPGPSGALVDSRRLRGGELFVGLRGESEDGGAYAAQALAAGAWGVLVTPEHAAAAAKAAHGGTVLVHDDPLLALQSLARSRRAELRSAGAKVVAVTGSTGKTSTKDILAALLALARRTYASTANLNTEIGLPLEILAAGEDCEVLVLELAMRGRGQIAELTEICAPDVGVIVNVGPAHLELLGSLEAIAAAKAELIAGLEPGAGIVLPAHEPLLEPHRRADLRTLTFGEGGDVSLLARREDASVVIRCEDGSELELRPSFSSQHNLRNLLAAVAAARLLAIPVAADLQVRFTGMRGERIALPEGVTLIDDCYNANPMSMRAALDELARTAPARRVAVLGEMLELGGEAPQLHRALGAYAAERGVSVLVAVGRLGGEIAQAFAGESHVVQDAQQAGELLAELVRAGDTVLVKGSRGVGLERAVAVLRAQAGSAPGVAAPGVEARAGSGQR